MSKAARDPHLLQDALAGTLFHTVPGLPAVRSSGAGRSLPSWGLRKHPFHPAHPPSLALPAARLHFSLWENLLLCCEQLCRCPRGEEPVSGH